MGLRAPLRRKIHRNSTDAGRNPYDHIGRDDSLIRPDNSRELITRLAASDGLETYKLIKSDEQLMEEEQQQAMMAQEQAAAQDPSQDPAKQAALLKAENDAVRTEQEVAKQAEGGGN